MGPGPGPGPEDAAAERLVRSLLLVRLVRGALVLVFLLVAFVGIEADHGPRSAVVVVGAAALVQAGALLACWRRLARTGGRARLR